MPAFPRAFLRQSSGRDGRAYVLHGHLRVELDGLTHCANAVRLRSRADSSLTVRVVDVTPTLDSFDVAGAQTSHLLVERAVRWRGHWLTECASLHLTISL